MKLLLILAAIATIACSSVVQAQHQEPKLKPSVSPRTPEPGKQLLLEINYHPMHGPAYANVDGVGEKPKWIWLTRFVRIPGHQMAAGELPIRAVKLESQFNGETADVRLTLYRGVKGFEKDELVAVYKVGLDEERTLSELSKVGIEPFIIKLVDLVPSVPLPPGFNNLTESVEVVKVESHNIPRPAYRITFQNLSDKPISALKVDLTTNGSPGVSTMFQAEEGRDLIKPGGTSEQYISVSMPGRLDNAAPSSNIINIRTAVFSDLTFEGEFQGACQFESYVMGRRLWLKQVVALLEQVAGREIGDHIDAAKQFKEKFSAFNYELNEGERNQRSVVSPQCPKPSQLAYIAPQGLKLELLRDLDRIIETRPAPPVNFKSWLEDRRTRYKAWLARL